MIINNLLSSGNGANQETLDEMNTKINNINTNVQWLVDNHGTDECPELPSRVAGTAQAAHVLEGQTFLNDNYGDLITGTMPNNGDVSDAIESGRLKAGFTSGGIIENLTAENIKKDVVIGGITGTVESGYDESIFNSEFYKYKVVTVDPDNYSGYKELVYGDTEGYTFYPDEGYVFDTISVEGSLYYQNPNYCVPLRGCLVATGRYYVSCTPADEVNGAQGAYPQMQPDNSETQTFEIRTVRNKAQYEIEMSKNQIRIYDTSTTVDSNYVGAVAHITISTLQRPIVL